MTSSGGMISTATAKQLPIQLIELGPAAGALFAARIGAQAGLSDLIAFDMGGTTAKARVVKDGRPLIAKSHETVRAKRFHRGSGLPVGVPWWTCSRSGPGAAASPSSTSGGCFVSGPAARAGARPGLLRTRRQGADRDRR